MIVHVLAHGGDEEVVAQAGGGAFGTGGAIGSDAGIGHDANVGMARKKSREKSAGAARGLRFAVF